MSDPHHAAPTPPPPAPKAKPGAVVIGFLVLLIGEIIILANSGIEMPRVLPEPNSTYAGSVDMLFWVILAIVGFFFILTEGLLVYFMVKYRAREGSKSAHTHVSDKLELLWTFIPGLILFFLAVFQTGTWGWIKFKGDMPSQDDPNVEVVQVFGMQFEWNFRYGGPDRLFGTEDDVVKKGEMHVPVDRKVVVLLQTRDVLHSFWLPNSRMKQDLLPGQTIPQWFEITKTGEWPIVCAELCGNLHTTMSGSLISHTEEGFQAWLAETRERAGPHIVDEDPIWKYWRQK